MSQENHNPGATPSTGEIANAVQKRVARERQQIIEARGKGRLALTRTFVKLSGPGWLQAAITLGGGSLSSALYLGVLGGYNFLWLQLLAIICGITMLGAILYVTLAMGQRPFPVIRERINPVLAWGWAIASLAASIVWCMPQFSLSVAVLQQNLFPNFLGADGPFGVLGGKILICGGIFAIAASIVWRYARADRGIRIFERILKIMVGVIIFSFIGVVVRLATSDASLPWGAILAGFVPDLTAFGRPTSAFLPYLAAIDPAQQDYWTRAIVSRQQDVMIAAAAAAVGINMTFFLPYSILARGWTKEFKGLAVFDMATGMAIPFVLVTSCIVIAAASMFYTQPAPGLMDGTAAPGLTREYNTILESRAQASVGDGWGALSAEEQKAHIDSIPESERNVAAMLVSRDAFQLANSLEPLTGRVFAQIVFGIGVIGMTISTIIMLMVITGVVLREMFDWPAGGIQQRVGSLVAGVGILGPFIWSGKALFWLAVPTSVVAMTLLPIAYFTFLLMMNSKTILKDDMPRGSARFTWNTLMIVATAGSMVAAGWSIWTKSGWAGTIAALLFIAAAVIVHITRKKHA